jgi:hypothetical protein
VALTRLAAAGRLVAALVTLCVGCAAVAAEPGRVLDVAEAPAAWGWREISGLAWGPDGRTLYAVSDRGRLWRWVPRIGHAGEGTRLHLDTAPQRIDLPAGLRPNGEALAWVAEHPAAPDGALLIADEREHRALLVSTHGELLSTLALPGVARDNKNSGVEAIGWRAGQGWIAALQRPPSGQQVHLLHGGDGRSQGFEKAAQRASLKALEVVGDAVWVLEKIDQGKTHRTLLRRLSAQGCALQQLCESARIELADPRVHESDNWEGLACRPDGLCVLVSDDGGVAGGRTALMLLRLPR